MSNAPARFCRVCGMHRLSVADVGDTCMFCRWPVRIVRGGRDFCRCGQRKSRQAAYCLDCQAAYNRRRRAERRAERHGETAAQS